jgi:hypothetical protein
MTRGHVLELKNIEVGKKAKNTPKCNDLEDLEFGFTRTGDSFIFGFESYGLVRQHAGHKAAQRGLIRCTAAMRMGGAQGEKNNGISRQLL